MVSLLVQLHEAFTADGEVELQVRFLRSTFEGGGGLNLSEKYISLVYLVYRLSLKKPHLRLSPTIIFRTYAYHERSSLAVLPSRLPAGASRNITSPVIPPPRS